MRIALFSNEYPARTGGIGAYVATLAPALVARGHDVHVISCQRDQERSDERDGGVHVHRRPFLPSRGVRRLIGDATSDRVLTALAAWAALRSLRLDFDVIEAPEWMAESLVASSGRTPVVVHLHTPLCIVQEQAGRTMERDRRRADHLERISVARAQVVTSPSALLVDALSERRWLRRPAEVIPNPIDIERWSAVTPAGDTQPEVLVVGRLERRKAPEVVVDACARIPGSSVVFVGQSVEVRDGLPYDKWLVERADRAGVKVTVTGPVGRDALAEWYQRARVVAVPSTFDNFPMVALEAMSAGRAVVCTERTGTSELLTGSDAGQVVPVHDVEATSEALTTYLDDAARAAAAGTAARTLVRATCGADVIAARREHAYERALDLRGTRRSAR